MPLSIEIHKQCYERRLDRTKEQPYVRLVYRTKSRDSALRRRVRVSDEWGAPIMAGLLVDLYRRDVGFEDDVRALVRQAFSFGQEYERERAERSAKKKKK